jgi:hypothetical protein
MGSWGAILFIFSSAVIGMGKIEEDQTLASKNYILPNY